MISLQTRILEKPFLYDGTQLRPHWIYQTTGLLGDAVVAFAGPANVSLKNMVDIEDVRNKEPIGSPNMLHFLGEWFIDSWDIGILLQQLFVSNIYESLWERGVTDLTRQGDDIYYKRKKLSVSISTRSPVSVLMHTGLNIQTLGTPIPTSGLSEFGIAPFEFARKILGKFSSDVQTCRRARTKSIGR